MCRMRPAREAKGHFRVIFFPALDSERFRRIEKARASSPHTEGSPAFHVSLNADRLRASTSHRLGTVLGQASTLICSRPNLTTGVSWAMGESLLSPLAGLSFAIVTPTKKQSGSRVRRERVTRRPRSMSTTRRASTRTVCRSTAWTTAPRPAARHARRLRLARHAAEFGKPQRVGPRVRLRTRRVLASVWRVGGVRTTLGPKPATRSTWR